MRIDIINNKTKLHRSMQIPLMALWSVMLHLSEILEELLFGSAGQMVTDAIKRAGLL